MTTMTTTTATTTERTPSRRRFLMCPPEHFAVTYEINPWMDTTRPVDTQLAQRQWEALRATYLRLGHDVDVITPRADLPDMVFAANGGLVIDGRAYGASFTHPERRAEGPAYLEWFAGAGLDAVPARFVNEGEGDILLVGDVVLAGTGFRTDLAAHDEVARLFGREVVSLELVDPRFYHLDTALSVLDDETIAYFPGAFSEDSQAELARRYPDAILATEADAAVLGLNCVSDGLNVVLSTHATGMIAALLARGFNPIGVDLGELLKAGGGAKCCTLILRG